MLIKIGVETIGPATLTSLRLWTAALILLLYLLIKKQSLPLHSKAMQLYLFVGIFANSLPFMLISWGEVRIDSSLAAILMGIMPIMTFVLAHFFIPSEPMTGRKVFGVTLGFAGLLTLVGLSALTGLNENVIGQLVVLLAACSYAVTSVYVRTQPTFSGLQMATGATLAGAVTSLPVMFLTENPFAVAPSTESLLAALTLAVFPTAIASLIYFRIIHSLGATTFSQINYLVPILGGIWGVILLNESLHWRMIIALLLVLTGIYFIQSKKRPPHSMQPQKDVTN